MYYLLYGFLYLLSLLPLGLLYLISDAAFVLVYYVLGYRKKVTLDNLRIAFPQKTEAEREKIAARFYRNFTDNFIETVKFISASKRFFESHFSGDFSAVAEQFKDGRSIHFHIGHNFNWELVNLAMGHRLPGPVVAVYLPLSEPVNRLMKKIRSRFGTHLVAATRMSQEMLPMRGRQHFITLIADQSPAIPQKAVWTTFFGRKTGFLKPPEAAARRNDHPVFFSYFTKPKRGHYQAHFELLSDHPKALQAGELTKRYAAKLEEVMSKNPELWLWSHRRWKHEWQPDWGFVD